MQRGFAPVILVLVLALLSVGLAYFYGVKQGKQSLPIALVSPSPESVVCTQDALQCPDGSYVGRTGPNCEFVCPGNETDKWKTYTDEVLGYSLKYPSDILVRYVCEQEGFILSRRSRVQTEDVVNMASCARDSKYDVEITISEKPVKPKSDEVYTVTETEVGVDGVKAKRFTSVLKEGALGPYEERFITVHIPKRGIVYQLHWGWDEKEEVFDRVLATFKFTY
ncbi:MAG: Uncharacterized protein G01um10145_300 [Microgenomates group bacterium Gr01-1014_5]|nr:MAG: Uncharacterized protein G01um10145_300 [Microgenomates group bacterium Gr01-1014_5]